MGRNVHGHGMVAPTVVTRARGAEASFVRSPARRSGARPLSPERGGPTSLVWPVAPNATATLDLERSEKVWTTLAHQSAFSLILARTDPDVPKHRGITAFLVDMRHAPGVEVRPLFQATGRATSSTRASEAQRLGGVGEGWGVSITTLMNERVSIGGTVPPRLRAHRRGGEDTGSNTGHVQDAHAPRTECSSWVRNEVGRSHQLARQQLLQGRHARPEGSVAQLGFAGEPEAGELSWTSWAAKACSTVPSTRRSDRPNRR